MDLSVAGDAPVADLPDGPLWVDGQVDVPAAATALGDPEYSGYAVIVFLRAGCLSTLELSYYDNPPAAWPPASTIHLH